MKSDIDTLKAAVKKLNDRYDELRAVSFTLGIRQKLELLDQLDLLNIKITRMETVLNHLQAATIRVRPPTEEEKQAVRTALSELSQSVAKDMQWTAVVKLTKSFLTAARTITEDVNVRTTA